MSDQDPTNPASKQTSSVPLKKETVRVTLKAADAPKASPSGAPPAPAAPKPTVAPKPPTPTAPKPPTATAPISAPPAPSAPGASKAPAPAPTIQLKTAPAPGAGAPTIRLNTAGSAPTAPAAPAAASPGPTVALPKATVQLNPPTQPLGSAGVPASQMATMRVSDQESSTGNEGIVNVLSILGFIGAAAVITIQLMTSAVWLGTDSDGQPQPVEWGRLF